ncbi:unnamed protein product [Dibothriocephalus latus]|uniref:Uncharacterized protein n=1 Tax=Dibothriocephalus latus TaxID=60516 RepID=A0A3P7NN68_DIBLA|nr:unnamed protein product [Dibothriocephalus latus]
MKMNMVKMKRTGRPARISGDGCAPRSARGRVCT